MSSTYRSRASDQHVADAYLTDFMPCAFCGRQTERAALIEYGARCGACYQTYLTGGKPVPPMPTREQRIALVQRMKGALTGMGRPSTQWAVKMREREEAGAQLSIAQRDAWRTALGAHGVLDAAREGLDVSRQEIDDALTFTGDIPEPSPRERYASDPRFAAWTAGVR